ncbi:hypothetical protein LguiA_027470 [Lonicera macranthoides]
MLGFPNPIYRPQIQLITFQFRTHNSTGKAVSMASSSSSIIKRTLLSTLPSNHPSISSSAEETLISTAVSILKHHRSKSRWNHLKSLFPTGLNPSHFSQITLQIRNNPHLALSFYQFTLRHSLCDHSLLSYSTIIHILSRGRLKSHALTLIQSAIVHFRDPTAILKTLIETYRNCNSAPFVFDLLIEACLRSNRVDQCINIVRMLRSRGISPSISTCNSLIRSVSKCQGSTAGFDMYREVFGKDGGGKGIFPNAYTFNEIMLAFYQDGLRENVIDVWSEMVRVNCVPNAYSFSILMAAYCEDGRIGEAIRIWEEMGVKDLKHDVVAYNTMIGGFCKIGELGKAEEFFREMEVCGVESTCVTYEHLINGYCEIGDVDLALLLWKDACRKDFRPQSFTFDAVIRGFCERNRVSEALEFFRGSGKKHGYVPKRESYEILIKGLCVEERMEEALKLQAEMVGKGYEPNMEIYNAFIDGYMKQGNEEQAGKLRMEMIGAQSN